MASKGRKSTNEQEFQGRVVVWLEKEVQRCHRPFLDKATSEKPDQLSGKRNDIVVWQDRSATKAFLTMELKTPTTPISDPVFFNDALSKAVRWKAPVFCLWNMQRAELYLTPDEGQPPSIAPFCTFDTAVPIKTVDEWLNPSASNALEDVAHKILDSAVFHLARAGKISVAFDSEVFVSRLEEVIHRLRRSLQTDLKKQIKTGKKIRAQINSMAAAQGFAGFVEDIDFAIAGQFAYRLAGQVLFYFSLRRKNNSLPELKPNRKNSLAPQLRVHWDFVRRFDYEALYGIDELEKLVPLSVNTDDILHSLIEMLAHYDWVALQDDVLGAIFEKLIPREEQILLGQFYTPKPVADLLVALVVDGESPLVLDPGCGSGTFLMSAYEYHSKVHGKSHNEILPKIWGFDLSPFATELASINLYRQNLSSFDNFPRIVPGSFFDRSVGEKIEFPPPKPPADGAPKKLKVPIPAFDAIIANPPYLRSQNQDDLDPNYRKILFASAARCGVNAPPKTDLFAFFLFHAYEFLREGGRVGFVTPTSWLATDYGVVVQQFLLNKMRLVSIVTSEAESLFSQVDVNTVLIIAEKPDISKSVDMARFISLKKPLAELFPQGPHYWDHLLNLASKFEAADNDIETAEYRIKTIALPTHTKNKDCLEAGSNWGRYLRAPITYYRIFRDDGLTTSLNNLAEIGIGFKSLQNDFFYVNNETVDTYGIENRFLNPIYTLSKFDSSKYSQSPTIEHMVFTCMEAEGDLKGTGALKYIRTMARRTAKQKKQTGATLTISEVLGKQGGRFWYAPKAAQNSARIWLRKGIGGIFSPLLCTQPLVVDQRCSFAIPKNGVTDDELSALLTSSVTSFSMEINGSISMGGGVLETPTSKLRTYPVPDILKWNIAQRNRLVTLAKAVWKSSKPIDWTSSDKPNNHLIALDEFVLQQLGISVSTNELYLDLSSAVASRYCLAKDKTGKQTKRRSESVASVAASVSNKLRPALEAKLFPEGFIRDDAAKDHFDILGMKWRTIELHPMMGQTEVWLESVEGERTQQTWPSEVAEIIVRAILLGRTNFDFPTDQSLAKSVLVEMLSWMNTLQDMLGEAIADSAAGSGYEDAVRADTLTNLGVHQAVLEKTLPLRIVR